MTAPLTDAELDALAEAEERATPGPWLRQRGAPLTIYGGAVLPSGARYRVLEIAWQNHMGESDVMLAARNALPALLAEVRASREAAARQQGEPTPEEVERVRKALKAVNDQILAAGIGSPRDPEEELNRAALAAIRALRGGT